MFSHFWSVDFCLSHQIIGHSCWTFGGLILHFKGVFCLWLIQGGILLGFLWIAQGVYQVPLIWQFDTSNLFLSPAAVSLLSFVPSRYCFLLDSLGYPLCMSTSGVKDSERFYRFGAAPFLWFSPTIFISFESPKFCPRAPYIILQVFFLCRYSCSCYKTREVIPSGKPSRPHKELILLLQVSSPLSAWFYHTLVPPVVFLVVFQSSLYMQDD